MVLTGLVSRFVILLVGVLYPAYASFKAVKHKDHRAYTTWMMYWIVFALFLTVETFTDVFLSWLPFYYEIKIVVVLWLALPYTEGAKTLYRRLIHHQLLDKEEHIDELLTHAGQAGLGIVHKASAIVVNQASTRIMTAAMRISGQEQQEQQQTIYQPEQPLVVRDTLLQRGPPVPDPAEDFVQVTVDSQPSDIEYKKTF